MKAAILRGIQVMLHTQVQTGTDPFNRPIYQEAETVVDNVLVTPATETEITDTLNITGRKAVYTLGIPKGNTNDWTDKKVSFFGQTFRTIGSPVEGIEEMIPLDWNKKVRCEVLNGES